MAEKISEGVTKEILRSGNGKMPKSGDTITVNCTGSLVDSQKKFWRFLRQLYYMFYWHALFRFAIVFILVVELTILYF